MRGLVTSVVLCFIWTVVTARRCGNDDWDVIFSAKAGSNESVYSAWTGSASINSVTPCANIYKPDAAEEWGLVDLVKVSVLKDNEEVAYFIFNGRGASKTSFFGYSKLLASSSGLFSSSPMQYFSMEGGKSLDRRFFIQRNYGGCGVDAGWLVVVDSASTQPCSWESRAALPYFLYCDQEAACLEDTAPIGDTFLISVKRF